MSEKMKNSLSKFKTISITDRTTKRGEFRTTQRKSNSVLMNPQNFNTTIQIPNNVSLPKITQKKRKKKYGTFLQSWLDQALGEADPIMTDQVKKNESADAGVLKTLKRFQLDKLYLQSLNIPGAKVERLYQSLYIYSHGVDKIFKQLLEFIEEYQNTDLLGNFWKAYTKLLQSCTSYQTVFQKVQKDHIQNIISLKHTLQQKLKSFEEQKKILQQKNLKMQKALDQKQSKFNFLNEEYKVMASTLGLTDEAFNQQVNLRLKFQQKINSVYTSYQQLKLKYTKIVEQMHIRKQQIMTMESNQNKLKNQLQQEKVKVDELQQRLDKEKEKVKDREIQIDIKRQQLQDIKQIYQAKINKDVEAGDIVQQQITKYKAINVKLIQSQNIIAGQKISLKTKQSQIQKLTNNLQQLKSSNNKLYEDNLQYGKTIVKLQTQILARTLTIKQNQNKISELSNQNQKLGSQLSEMTEIKQNLDKETTILNKTVDAHKITKDKNQQLISQLKAVKDKYERINQMLRDNIEQVSNDSKIKTNALNQSIGQIQSLKMLIDSRNKNISMIQKQLQQQRQVFKVKQDALNTVINKKQSMISQIQNKNDEINEKICDIEIKVKKLQMTIISKDSQNMKLQANIASKSKQIQDLGNQVQLAQQRYDQLVRKMQKNLQQKQTTQQKLSTAQYVLKKRKQEQNLSHINLKKLLNNYKQTLQYKAQYVHPMVYEQARTIAIQAQSSEKAHRRKFKQITKINKQLAQKTKDAQQKYNKLEEKHRQLQQNHSLVLKKGDDLVKQVSSQKCLIEKNRKKINELEVQLSKKNKQIEDKNQQINHTQSQVRKMREQNQGFYNLEKQMKTQISKLKDKLKFLKKKQEQNARAIKTPSNIKKPVEKFDAQAQTQTVNIKTTTSSKTEQLDKQFQQIGIQTQIQQSQQQKQESLIPKYESPLKQEDTINLTSSPPKKIQKRDFKKALKFTYMRR